MKSTIQMLLVVFIITGCSDTFFDEEPANSPEGNFESLWQTFDERYAVFEQRGVDWNALYTQYRPMVTEQTTDDELFEIITSMLSNLDDGHVSLMAPRRPFWNSKGVFRTQEGSELFNLFVVLNQYLEGNYTQIDDQVYYGVFEDEIGYMFINHLSNPIPMDEILASMSGVEAMIIDLRHNNGGDFTNGEAVASRFAGQRKLAFSGQPKNGPGPDDFGKVTEYFIEPANTNSFRGPVAVITSRYTISAGENLVMYLRVLDGVTVFGESTAGAMGERIEKEMPNGWIYSISGQIMRAADGVSYEGPGLPPDVPFENRLEDVENGIDSLFLNTVQFLRNQL